MFDFRMPALGADMDKGILAAWHVKPGDLVKKGDIVADVETDKGTIEVEIWQPGEVSEILVQRGQEVPVGTPLARLKTDAEDRVTVPEPSQPTQKEVPEPTVTEKFTAPAAPIPAARFDTGIKAEREHIRISPLARKVAKGLGIDLHQVHGSGPEGAITRADVEAFAGNVQDHPAEDSVQKEDKNLAMRRAIGLAMVRSKREIPHYYLKTDINMAVALNWLKEENARRSVTERLLPVVLGLKAVARAVKSVPEVNGHFVDGMFYPQNGVHLGIAISLRQGGLVAPAIHDAEQKSLPELMRNLMDLVQRARSGKLRGSEVSDQTITVTNLGDTGVDEVFGVIHPPQVAMVGFGRITERPWAANGMVGSVPVLTITLAADHRASDGHRGGIFLSTVDKLLQKPQLL